MLTAQVNMDFHVFDFITYSLKLLNRTLFEICANFQWCNSFQTRYCIYTTNIFKL